MVDLYEVEQRRFAYLTSLQQADPFQYQYLYGDSKPRDVVQHGGTGALNAQGYFTDDPTADPQVRVEEARKKFGGDIDRLKNQNPIPTEETATTSTGTTDTATATEGPPPYQGPSAFQKLSGLLPAGFDTTALPSNFANPFVEEAFKGQQGKVEDFISRMLNRGTVTSGGANAARASLGSQEAGVKEQLGNIANLKLEAERSKLRGIATPGYTAAQAPGETGEFFDPSPYKSAVDTDLAQFQQAFPADYSKSVGEAGDLFNTAGLQGVAGAVTGPANLSYDPYAQTGGKLSTGIEDEDIPSTTGKKRTTAVF